MTRRLFFLISSFFLWLLRGFRRGSRKEYDEVFKALKKPTGELPTIEIDNVIPHSSAFCLHHPQEKDGSISLLELLLVIRLAARSDYRTLFEIGTFEGRTTVNLAANTCDEARIFTLDLPENGRTSTKFKVDEDDRAYMENARVGVLFEESQVRDKILQLWGDSAKFDFSPYINQIDFCFVDGAHSQEYVLNDSNVAYGMVREFGLIVWHDYLTWPDVTSTLEELRRTDVRFKELRHIRGTALVVLKVEKKRPRP